MKIEKMVMACLMLSMLLIPVVNANTAEDEIAARIMKAGSVCVQGADCAQASETLAVAGAGSTSPQTHYDNACKTCHSMGIAGAPIFGDKEAWKDRIAKGTDVLYLSVLNGLAPGMPARGLCMSCTDDDLKAIVDLMVAEVSN
ncbi:MAG: cytochrome c5 [Cyclobacteriaceae bacterium]